MQDVEYKMRLCVHQGIFRAVMGLIPRDILEMPVY